MQKSKSVQTHYFTFAQAPNELKLSSGLSLGPITLAYEIYGELNADKSNAILICHALSGDAHAAGMHENDKKPGWWDGMIGPGKAFDTSAYCVICSNVIGGCKGSTGPSSINPKTKNPYGLSFPVVTIKDMVAAQKHLIDHLEIKKLFCVAGGSMGGMQVLKWTTLFPEAVRSAIVIATNTGHNAQQIAFHEVGRQAIMTDPNWNNGDYYGKTVPATGMAIARMIGHITYMSADSMELKFGRQLINKEHVGYDFSQDFQVENYLRYRGDSFVQRFDANSYLYISKAIDYFNLAQEKSLVEVFKETVASFLILSFSSDWLYPTHQLKSMIKALKINDIDVTSCEINSAYGHDAFLVEIKEQSALIGNFLKKIQKICETK